MAFLNTQERTDLLNDLKKRKYGSAKRKLRRMDPKGSMAYFRNAQAQEQIVTCFNLDGLGTRVYLIEKLQLAPLGKKTTKFRAKFNFIEVIVEPTAENRT